MINKYINGILKAVNGVWELAVAGTDYLTPTGDGSGLTGIASSDTITNKTANYTIVAADLTGRTKFTNSGAAGTVIFTLPTAAANYRTAVRIVEAQIVTITPQAGDTIFMGGTTLAAGTSVSAKVVGFEFIIESYAANKWVVRGVGVQPSFLAKPVGGQNIAINTLTVITLPTEDKDNNDNFNNSTYTWTPTVLGTYLLSYGLNYYIGALNGLLSGRIYRNSSEWIVASSIAGASVNTNDNNIRITIPIEITTTTEAIQFQGYATINAATLQVGSGVGYSFFTATRIPD